LSTQSRAASPKLIMMDSMRMKRDCVRMAVSESQQLRHSHRVKNS
jgi:hypothetical protein